MVEFDRFKSLRSQGVDALEAYRVARSTGLDQITSIRMLRTVYGLSLDEAKKIGFESDTGRTYEEQNSKLVDEFTKIIDDELGSE